MAPKLKQSTPARSPGSEEEVTSSARRWARAVRETIPGTTATRLEPDPADLPGDKSGNGGLRPGPDSGRGLLAEGPLPLTIRESEVMGHLGRGLLYKEIAAKMGISFAKVHKLQHRIFTKLRVGNRTEAINKWKISRTK